MTTASIGAHTRPALGRSAAVRGTLTAWRRNLGSVAFKTAARAVTLRRAALTIAGFSLVDTSAFQLGAGHVGTGVGLLTTGLSVFAFEYLTSGD